MYTVNYIHILKSITCSQLINSDIVKKSTTDAILNHLNYLHEHLNKGQPIFFTIIRL